METTDFLNNSLYLLPFSSVTPHLKHLMCFALYWWVPHPGPDLENSLLSSCHSCKQDSPCQWIQLCWQGPWRDLAPFQPTLWSHPTSSDSAVQYQLFWYTAFNIWNTSKLGALPCITLYCALTVVQSTGHPWDLFHTWFFERGIPFSKGNM